ncbi:hypothetical protein BOTBODRAFT_215236 [Botryobasidium botryosum FD-172 SS1]|uniref:Uncharacterized protein n=1 Tax=Botryobasidium botryosum (strain FD-172 SS1) TaxID=930990 RepID=A0A067NCN8_BOTB1|nr:hypothetical protein BOTBODRAFT_215236 [Botryobasidium botryosum FD-172 SS1]
MFKGRVASAAASMKQGKLAENPKPGLVSAVSREEAKPALPHAQAPPKKSLKEDSADCLKRRQRISWRTNEFIISDFTCLVSKNDIPLLDAIKLQEKPLHEGAPSAPPVSPTKTRVAEVLAPPDPPKLSPTPASPIKGREERRPSAPVDPSDSSGGEESDDSADKKSEPERFVSEWSESERGHSRQGSVGHKADEMEVDSDADQNDDTKVVSQEIPIKLESDSPEKKMSYGASSSPSMSLPPQRARTEALDRDTQQASRITSSPFDTPPAPSNPRVPIVLVPNSDSQSTVSSGDHSSQSQGRAKPQRGAAAYSAFKQKLTQRKESSSNEFVAPYPSYLVSSPLGPTAPDAPPRIPPTISLTRSGGRISQKNGKADGRTANEETRGETKSDLGDDPFTLLNQGGDAPRIPDTPAPKRPRLHPTVSPMKELVAIPPQKNPTRSNAGLARKSSSRRGARPPGRQMTPVPVTVPPPPAVTTASPPPTEVSSVRSEPPPALGSTQAAPIVLDGSVSPPTFVPHDKVAWQAPSFNHAVLKPAKSRLHPDVRVGELEAKKSSPARNKSSSRAPSIPKQITEPIIRAPPPLRSSESVAGLIVGKGKERAISVPQTVVLAETTAADGRTTPHGESSRHSSRVPPTTNTKKRTRSPSFQTSSAPAPIPDPLEQIQMAPGASELAAVSRPEEERSPAVKDELDEVPSQLLVAPNMIRLDRDFRASYPDVKLVTWADIIDGLSQIKRHRGY